MARTAMRVVIADLVNQGFDSELTQVTANSVCAVRLESRFAPGSAVVGRRVNGKAKLSAAVSPWEWEWAQFEALLAGMYPLQKRDEIAMASGGCKGRGARRIVATPQFSEKSPSLQDTLKT